MTFGTRKNMNFHYIVTQEKPMLDNRCTEDFDGIPVTIDGKPVTILEWLAAHRKESDV
ncbi:MAG: hypothetical protein SOY73_09855 [Blautia sp.]|nr:hypothetical protein [Blautia sp.]MDY3999376.1 hypothetical protein [Blautia sp.]